MEQHDLKSLTSYNFDKKKIKKLLKLIKGANSITEENLIEESINTIGVNKLESLFVLNYLIDFNFLSTSNNRLRLKFDFLIEEVYISIGQYYFNLLLNNKKIKEDFFIKPYLLFSEERDLIIKRSTIPIELRPLIQNLSEFDFVKPIESNKDFRITNIDFAMELLRISLEKLPNSKTQKEFDEVLNNRKINGELSEIFVLNHEKRKLSRKRLNPVHCSLNDVGLGYDILSFDLSGRQIFIEVKTINRNSFFFTANESDKSKLLGDDYFIYCVEFKDGSPHRIKEIIKNPYHQIFIEKKFKLEKSEFRILLN